jgi:hypothetical protein
MANIETSFIPEQGGTYQYGARRSYAATIFAVFVTVIAIGATVYVWWALRKEKLAVEKYAVQLQSTEKNFDFDKIATLAQLDKRINLARDMFNKHSMPSLVIDYLSDHTVSTIKWKQFTYKKMVPDAKASPDGVPAGDTLELSGDAMGYGALYQQLAHFRSQNRVILYTELSSFHIDPRTGVVAITMKLVLRPTYATFATVRERMAQAEATPPVETTPAAAPAPVDIAPPVPAPAVTKPTTTTPTAPATTTKTVTPPITRPAVTPVGQ